MAGPVADFVVSLGQDGRILCQGTLSEALKSNKALLKEVKAEEGEVAKADETIDDVLPEIPEGKGGKLILKEEIAEGHVSWSASKSFVSCARMVRLNLRVLVKMYIVGMGGSFPVLFWIVVLGCWSVEEVTLVVVSFSWLSYPHFSVLTPHSKLGSWVTGPPNTRSFPRGRSILSGKSRRQGSLYSQS